MKKIMNWFRKLGYLELGAMAIAFMGTSALVFSRVRDINPAILQDEWIYSITSRQYSPWAQDLPFDFGNYLFNFIYSSTALCSSDTFYTCVKVLNLVFIQGFALTLFVVALRFLPFWGAFAFYVATMLSPTSIYSSMFLPEPLFFFLLGLTLIFLLHAAKEPTWKNWALVGAILGLASLVKPHAFMAAMAVGIFILVSTIRVRPFWKTFGLYAVSAATGFLLTRVVVGFAIAGPKSLNVFGAYGGAGAIGEFVGGVATGGTSNPEVNGLVGAGSVVGAAGLFPTQLYTHMLVIAALLGTAVTVLIVANVNAFTTSEVRPVHQYSTLMLIWLSVLVIVIVLFTGWITGAGDDHTTRVLLRYYDYLFPMVTLAGVAVAFDKQILSETKSWIRWVAIAPTLLLISIAFTGYFGTLTIQIADAPNLAGLVVDKTTIDVTANLSFLTLLVLAFFPRFTIWAMAALVPWVMIATGYQIQDQYRGFRAEESAADKAGHYVAESLTREQLDELVILAESRFDGRAASFWLEHNTDLEILNTGTVYPAQQLPEGTKWVLTIGDLKVDAGEVVSTETGYQLVKLGQ